MEEGVEVAKLHWWQPGECWDFKLCAIDVIPKAILERFF